MADQQPAPDTSTPVPGPCPDDSNAGGQSLGGWLRAQRLARGWSVNEMGRQLSQTAKTTGDHTVPGAMTLAAYVRRWEKDMIGVTERYRLLYCQTLNLPPTQFGPSPGQFSPPPRARPARAPHPAAPGSMPLGPPAPYPGATSPIAVVIGEGCPPVVIHLARPGPATTPTPWPPPNGNHQHRPRQDYAYQPLLADDDYLAALVTAALDQASDPAAMLHTALRTPPTAPSLSPATTPPSPAITPINYGGRA